jgi:hypothetical protein
MVAPMAPTVVVDRRMSAERQTMAMPMAQITCRKGAQLKLQPKLMTVNSRKMSQRPRVNNRRASWPLVFPRWRCR